MKRGAIALACVPLVTGCDVTFHGGPASAEFTLAAGGLVSIIAMILYYQYRRSGEPSGFKRFATFITGLPLTVFIMVLVEEDAEAAFRRIDDDDEAYDLVRMERELEAFRAHRESVEARLGPPRSAPPTPKGLASSPPDPGPRAMPGV